MTETLSAPARSAPIGPPRVETPHYEGVPADALLPARGEEVWVDHPIFINNRMLANAVIGTGFDLGLEMRKGDESDDLKVIYEWIHGRIPIPLPDLDELVLSRAFFAADKGIPFDDLPPVRSAADSEGLLFDSIPVQEIDEPHYKGWDPDAPLPASGEDVWVDHPIFSRCPLFALELADRREEATDLAELDWLEGRKPIPADTLEELVAERESDAAYVGLRIAPSRAID